TTPCDFLRNSLAALHIAGICRAARNAPLRRIQSVAVVRIASRLRISLALTVAGNSRAPASGPARRIQWAAVVHLAAWQVSCAARRNTGRTIVDGQTKAAGSLTGGWPRLRYDSRCG